MATANFYHFMGDNKEVEKSLGEVIVSKETIRPYEPLDDISGTLLLEYSANIEGCNYCVYDGKNYFVTDKVREIGGKIRITLKSDVLMNYWSGAQNAIAIITRSAKSGAQNTYLPDNTWPIQQDPEIVIHNFGEFTYTDQQIVVNIVG